ncbi:MAG: DinB family protein [Gemmatimonadetes bacterium]|nr:DinB family protein [Gemmatimonadota bacterium]
MGSPLGADFAFILGRDLDALAAQIERYPDDASLWRVAETPANPTGTLTLHVVGNLRHYVGAVLGGSGYRRDREREFSRRDLGRKELVDLVRACRAEVVPVLQGLGEEALSGDYPGDLPTSMHGATTQRFLLHLAGHFMWHLGQADYHRRLLAVAGPAKPDPSSGS